MSTRTLTNTVNPDIIALNAAIFGYAGHSVLTPHGAIQQIWWTEARIAEKVTPEFVKLKLRPEARAHLDFAIGFGDGLSDDTYMEWILSRAKRLFLVLVECAVPEQIFGMVDDSWDDDDLPISEEDATRLAQRDYRLSKLYTAQFQFLLRQLTEGSHIDYASNETVPLDYVQRLPPAAALQRWSRVHMPNAPERIFVRRKISLDENDETRPTKEQFLHDIETAQSIQNDHIAPVFATYTAKSSAYFLTTFISEHTLKSFMDFRTPASMQKIDKAQRSAILLQWLHCLADAVSTIHENGLVYTAITPSNITLDASNKIAFSDIGSLQTFQTDKRMDPNEAYNYNAPEANTSLPSAEEEDEFLPPLKPTKSRFFYRRRKSNESKATSSSSNSSSSRGQSYAERESYINASRTSTDSQATYLPSRAATHTSTSTPSFRSSTITQASSTGGSHKSVSDRGTIIISPSSSSATLTSDSADTSSSFGSIVSLYASRSTTSSIPAALAPPSTPAKADIFSLGCVFLDILTFALSPKHSPAFVKFRSSKLTKASTGSSTRPSMAQGFRTPTGFNTAMMRPTGKVDASFHANLSRVGEWIDSVAHDAFDREDPAFRAYPQLLALVRAMVQLNPALRPDARSVRARVREILALHAQRDVECERCLRGQDFGLEGAECVRASVGRIGGPSVPGCAGRAKEVVVSAPGVPLAAGRSGLEGQMGGLKMDESVGYAGMAVKSARAWRRRAVGVS